MKTIERLYYVKEAYWLNMSYSKALNTKMALSNIVIRLIHNKPHHEVTNDDTKRINECIRAIKFNEGLLNE